ncbi:hypothetical protein, partial [Corynebacterium sp.]|uniref:hypothetical protein n=1 Tax=Corynebacterium sp. TaxID=1720 RepID=UPI002A91E94D
MNNKRVIALSASVMLGVSTAVVPVVSPSSSGLPAAVAQTAQSDPLPQETVENGDVQWDLARYSDGRLVALATSEHVIGSQTEGAPVYEWNGVEYPMELKQTSYKADHPANAQMGGETLYAWYVVTQDGRTSTECSYD